MDCKRCGKVLLTLKTTHERAETRTKENKSVFRFMYLLLSEAFLMLNSSLHLTNKSERKKNSLDFLPETGKI